MGFISLKFVAFFVVLLAVVALLKKKEHQHIALLIGSYVFYALGDIRFLALLIGISLTMWYLGLQISKNNKKAKLFLSIGVIIDLVTLGVFKYLNFFIESFCDIIGMQYTSLKIILPIGISFYIFQSISYLADVYSKRISAEKNVINVLLYIGFFPQIVSGPIVKAHKFLPQLNNPVKIEKQNLSIGIQRIMLGLFKKVVIADRLGVCVNAVYNGPTQYNSISVALAVVSYSLQIYYDFSGYSDMAIGVAKILGFDLGENFNLPYLAKNPSDFWKRWHISLSSWFREYVYFPLGGNRKGKARTYFNLFVTMVLSGIWHGASWSFVIWGLLHALASVVHKMYISIVKKSNKAPSKALSIIGGTIATVVTYITVALLWIPFRTNDMRITLQILKQMFSFSSNGVSYTFNYTLVFVAMLIVVELIAVFKNKSQNIWKPLDLSKFWSKVVVLLFAILIFVFAYTGDTAFIYANF